MNAILKGKMPDGKDEQFVLTGGCVFVGRHGDILLRHASVSRRHASLECREEGWILSDLGSRNGTTVNGVSVQRRLLTPGDIVAFGRVKMLFEYVRDDDDGETSIVTMDTCVISDMSESAASLVGRSEALQLAMKLARRAARSDATVLVFGESGTGKELFARLVYEESNRRGKPFVPVHSSAIEPNLLVSTLFGHEKGAFTGAVAQKKGLFEEANGGTIFLDEIGELSLDTQVKLLRVLQEGEFMRVGGTQPIHVDVRVICATNRDLAAAVKEGKFREDLYYRLNVIQISLPPLRERTGDVPDLVNHYISLLGGPTKSISPGAMEALVRYQWPGNVRELRNMIERTLILSENDRLEIDDFRQAGFCVANVPQEGGAAPKALPQEGFECPIAPPKGGVAPDAPLKIAEREHIMTVLDQCGGNMSLAAKKLGISRSTLYEKKKLYEKS